MKRLLLVVALWTVTLPARATPHCDELCSVPRACSSTGAACDADDRDCTSAATGKGLEIRCESRCETAKKRFVYCPPDTGRADSGFIWVLLALAGALAVGGTGFAWSVLRKSS